MKLLNIENRKAEQRPNKVTTAASRDEINAESATIKAALRPDMIIEPTVMATVSITIPSAETSAETPFVNVFPASFLINEHLEAVKSNTLLVISEIVNEDDSKVKASTPEVDNPTRVAVAFRNFNKEGPEDEKF